LGRAVGLPARTYYQRRARHHAGHQVRGPWPTPARDGIRATVCAVAVKYPMWGHGKIAWLARHEHGLDIADATCLRILPEAGLTLPVDYVRKRRDLAGAHRQAFVELPTRRNRVWQTDFFELETGGGGTWRSGDVIDSATKLVLAGPVTATHTARDAIASAQAAIDHAGELLGRPLIADAPTRRPARSPRRSGSPTTAPASRAPHSHATSTPGPSCATSAHAAVRRRPTA
jgi:hypothetical protein